jgi:Spy/CpxP family protein refolding chaperone
MKRTLLSIGLTGAAVFTAVVLASAQTAGESDQDRRAPARVDQAQPGQVGPGRGLGPAQGRGRAQGMLGRGQGLGRGQAMLGRGQGRMGRGPAMQGRGPAMQGRGPATQGRGAGAGLAALNLTDDQRAKITDLHRAERDQAAALQDQLEVARKALHREIFADKRDSGRINDLSGSIAKLERQLADVHIRTASSVADILTPEQRETMRLRDERAGAGRGPGPGGFGPRGRGPGRQGPGGR